MFVNAKEIGPGRADASSFMLPKASKGLLMFRMSWETSFNKWNKTNKKIIHNRQVFKSNLFSFFTTMRHCGFLYTSFLNEKKNKREERNPYLGAASSLISHSILAFSRSLAA